MLKKIIFLSLCAFVLLLMFSSQGSSLKCYQCNSHIEKSCDAIDEKEDKPFLKTCEDNQTLCRTQYSTIRGEKRVVRSCGITKHKNPCYAGASLDLKSHTCECEMDGCNAAIKAESDIVKLISIVSVSLYFFR